MKIQPVEMYLKILKLISSHGSDTGVGVNEICKLTGYEGYKQPICKLIRDLEKAAVIKTKKSGHSQKRPKVFTELGREIANLMDDIDKCNDAHIAIKKILLERKQAGLKNRSDEEEQEFLKGTGLVVNIENLFQKNVYNSLIFRYRNILAKFDLNQHAKRIITRILVDEIENQLLNTQETRKVPIDQYAQTFEDHILFQISEEVFTHIDGVCLLAIQDKTIWMQTRNLILCLLRLFSSNVLPYIKALSELNPNFGNLNHISLQLFGEYLDDRQELSADSKELLNLQLTEEAREWIRRWYNERKGDLTELGRLINKKRSKF
jgi:hypothetical protein